MHFLCFEPRETDKNVLKFTNKIGPEISLIAPGSPAGRIKISYHRHHLFVQKQANVQYVRNILSPSSSLTLLAISNAQLQRGLSAIAA